MRNPFQHIRETIPLAWQGLRRRLTRFIAWQRKGVEAQPLATEPHTCLNCATAFTGNYCPRCGQSADVSRFTFKHAIRKTLEVWGLGNRSLPRTLWHLIYRPGYMIGDYLEGRQAPYFPPVKMLFLVTAMYLLALHFIAPDIMEQGMTDAIRQLEERKFHIPAGEGAYPGKQAMLHGMNNFIDAVRAIGTFFQRNQAVEAILSHSLFALITMRVFRKSPSRPGMNLTECFFSQVFIASQLLMVSLACILVMGTNLWKDNMYSMPTWLLLLVLLYDYKQLYGFSLPRTAWYTVKTLLGFCAAVAALILAGMALSVVWTALTA